MNDIEFIDSTAVLDLISHCDRAIRAKGNPGGSKNADYCNLISAFDIETSRIPGTDESLMYIWQWAFEDKVIIGRTWEEFLVLQRSINKILSEKRLILPVLVHNLSFEFSFIKSILDFSTVFCLKPRKVAKAVSGHLEFRCTYIHSNMGLAEYTSKMGAKHQKLSGDEFDYRKTRYPWSQLKPQEIQYCVHDVIGLIEAYKIEMDRDGDTIYTIPMTSTGYVRRDAKAAMRMYRNNLVRDSLPSWEVYQFLREEFRGGDTHANRYHVGQVLEGVKSVDRCSSYPDVILNCKFPMGRTKPIDHLPTAKAKFPWIARIAVSNYRQKDSTWGFPYLSFHKLRNCRGFCLDNGRVLSFDYAEMTVNDIDYQIIRKEANFNVEFISGFRWMRYALLPDSFREVQIEYYTKKTELKGISGQEYFYMKSKNKTNSVYGLTAQDPAKADIIFDGSEFIVFALSEENFQESQKRLFLPYQWGCWVTAWARLRLREGLWIAGHNGVYCDTDSVKYFGEEIDLAEYNEQRIKESRKHGATAFDKKGVEHPTGVFEPDGEYHKFITWGAKKYAYTVSGESQIHVTISGVSKKKGGKELQKYGLKAFRPGFIFREGGGTESVYNDHRAEYREIDGHKVLVTSNVTIKESTYKVGITDDYEKLLDENTELLISICKGEILC